MRIKKLLLFIPFMLLLVTTSIAQKLKEFEGKIYYNHLVTAIDTSYNIKDDYNYTGTESVFFYKEGKYKWVNSKAYVEMEVFNNLKATSCLKFYENDTIVQLKSDLPNEKVIEFSILKNGDKILGHTCDVFIIKAGSNGNSWERRYSFANDYKINPTSFKNYKYNSTDFIYSKINALPLRIELIFKDRKISYTASNVEMTKLSDEIFEFTEGTKFKDHF